MSQPMAEKAVAPPVLVAPEEAASPPSWDAWLSAGWQLDPRSLALFRVSVGLILLYDLQFRLPDLETMYAEGAVIPLDLVRQYAAFPWQWSPFLLSDAWGWQAALFGLFACCAAALVVGWQTRWATIACWLLLASLQARMPTGLSSGDELMRLLLFWSMFLPLGQVWSLDAWRAGTRSDFQPVCSAGSFAFVGQLCLMYLCTAFFKWSDFWLEGRALDYALRPDQYGSPLGAWFLQFPYLLKLLTWATLVLEFAGPLVIFLPWGNAWWRLAAIASFTGLHLGIHYCLNVGLFSEICIAAWWALLPAMAWEAWPLCRVGLWFDRETPAAESDAAAPSPAAAEGGSLSPTVAHALSATVIALFIYVVLWNLNTLRETKFYGGRETVPIAWDWLMPVDCQQTAQWLALRQKWAMFAVAGRYSLWWVARARLADGSEVDLLRGGRPVRFEKPPTSGDCYPNHRWDKHFRMISSRNQRYLLQPTAEFLARRWNAASPPPRQVVALDLVVCYEQVDIEPGAVRGDFETAVRAHWPLAPGKTRNLFAELWQSGVGRDE